MSKTRKKYIKKRRCSPTQKKRYTCYSDKSLIRNKLTFDLSNSIGYSASRTKFYNLFI